MIELASAFGFELAIVRYSGLYGPGRVIRRDALARGQPISGDPDKYLNLIHIEDAASAGLAALDLGKPGRVYLAGDDRPVVRREIRLAKTLGKQVTPIKSGPELNLSGLPRWLGPMPISPTI